METSVEESMHKIEIQATRDHVNNERSRVTQNVKQIGELFETIDRQEAAEKEIASIFKNK